MFKYVLRLIVAVFLDICILASMTLYFLGQEGVIIGGIIVVTLKTISIGFLQLTRNKKKPSNGGEFIKWIALKLIPGIGSFFATNTGRVLSGA